jgi:IS605 OrfB family transposase
MFSDRSLANRTLKKRWSDENETITDNHERKILLLAVDMNFMRNVHASFRVLSHMTATATYSFCLGDSNTLKRAALFDQLASAQSAYDYTLDQFKLRCVMQAATAYDAGKAIYAGIRLHLPSLGSKQAQRIIAEVASSTLSHSREKLLRTNRIAGSLTFDDQMFDVRQTALGYRQWFLRLSDGHHGQRKYPLTGIYSSTQLASPHVISIDQAKVVVRLKDGIKTLFANITCTVSVPEPKAVDGCMVDAGTAQLRATALKADIFAASRAVVAEAKQRRTQQVRVAMLAATETAIQLSETTGKKLRKPTKLQVLALLPPTEDISDALRQQLQRLLHSSEVSVMSEEASTQVYGLDFNKNRICGSDGKHWMLTEHVHLKRMLRSEMRRSGGPQSLAGNQYYANSSRDFWRKQAAAIAEYCAELQARVVAVEDMTGIKLGAKSRRKFGAASVVYRGKDFNWMLHAEFPFEMFQQFLQSALQQAGVMMIKVPPAYTSQTCPHCGHVSASNRKTQARFACTSPGCGYVAHADFTAAVNVKNVATTVLGFMPTAFQLSGVRQWGRTAGRKRHSPEQGSTRLALAKCRTIPDTVGSSDARLSEDPIACDG